MEESRGHAQLHAMQVSSILESNIKLVRRKAILDNTTLSAQLKTAAYRLPFHTPGSKLFGEGIVKILETDETQVMNKQTRSFVTSMSKTLASTGTGARPKAPSTSGQHPGGRGRGTSSRGSHHGGGNRGKGSARGRAGSKGTSHTPAATKKGEDRKGGDRKGDKGGHSTS